MHRGTEGLVDAGLQPAAVCFFSIYKQRTLKGAPIPPASARKLASLPGFPLRRLAPTKPKPRRQTADLTSVPLSLPLTLTLVNSRKPGDFRFAGSLQPCMRPSVFIPTFRPSDLLTLRFNSPPQTALPSAPYYLPYYVLL